MTQEEKELLIKDLSARLPYNTIVQIKNSGIWNLKGIDQDNFDEIGYKVVVWHGKKYPSSKTTFPITICKPYLFPLSSMTEEKKNKLGDELIELELKALSDEIDHSVPAAYEIDYYNSHHIDYRGLIEKGLALDATNLNIY